MNTSAAAVALGVLFSGSAIASDRNDAFTAKAQLTDASVALGKIRHLDIDSGYAYLVVPTTLPYTKAGKPVTDKAIVTMSLKKASSGWQITGWAWADQ